MIQVMFMKFKLELMLVSETADIIFSQSLRLQSDTITTYSIKPITCFLVLAFLLCTLLLLRNGNKKELYFKIIKALETILIIGDIIADLPYVCTA